MVSFKKKKEVYFLLDKNNDWIEKYLKKYFSKFPKNFIYKLSKNPKQIKNKIVFVLSYTRILKKSFLKQNKEVLIVHPSKLPDDKGFAPVQYQILKKKNLIHVSLIRAVQEVDAGPIAIRDTFSLEGHELSEEIRKKQSQTMFSIISKFLIKYPKVKFKNQKSAGNFNRRRYAKDSELDINKSIKSQFNLLRIVDNKFYPAFFKHMNNTYYLTIKKK